MSPGFGPSLKTASVFAPGFTFFLLPLVGDGARASPQNRFCGIRGRCSDDLGGARSCEPRDRDGCQNGDREKTDEEPQPLSSQATPPSKKTQSLCAKGQQFVRDLGCPSGMDKTDGRRDHFRKPIQCRFLDMTRSPWFEWTVARLLDCGAGRKLFPDRR